MTQQLRFSAPIQKALLQFKKPDAVYPNQVTLKVIKFSPHQLSSKYISCAESMLREF